jgi:hypothetical protein
VPLNELTRGQNFGRYIIQIAQTDAHAFHRRNESLAVNHILFDDSPACIAVFCQKSEETVEIDTSASNPTEHSGADGLREVKLLAPSFAQNASVDVFDVDVMQQGTIFSRLIDGISPSVYTVPGIKAQTDLRCGECVE